MKRFSIAAGLIFLLSFTLFAQTYRESLRSAENYFRVKNYSAARAEAIRAKELAASEEEKLAAGLLLAKILVALNEKKAAQEEYLAVINSPVSNDSRKAEACLSLSEILIGEKNWSEARKYLEKIFPLQVEEKIKNKALSQYLMTWSQAEDIEGLKKVVDGFLKERKEIWPGFKVQLLTEAARILSSTGNWRLRDYKSARTYYREILSLPEIPASTLLTTYLNIAKSYFSEGNYQTGRKVLTEASEKLKLNPGEKVNLLREIARSYALEKDYLNAIQTLDKALSQEIPEESKGTILVDMREIYQKQENLPKLLETTNRILSWKQVTEREKIQSLFVLGDFLLRKKEYDKAAQIYNQVFQYPGLSVSDRYKAMDLVARCYLLAKQPQKAAAILEEMSKLSGANEEQKFLISLRLAGSQGAMGEIDELKGKIKQLIQNRGSLSLEQTLNCLWKAGQTFLSARYYEVVEEFLSQANSLGSCIRNEYFCRFVRQAPVGVGGWIQSDFFRDRRNKEDRFYEYNKQDAATLMAADVTAQRPFADKPPSSRPGETSFYMCYDTAGWHIFIHTEEPNIQQIMLENGRGSSSLEMFFQPGRERVSYYQWIINLATGETNIYDWDSPHRWYRPLELGPGNIKVETSVLDDGWGTIVFLPWECLYDRLPFQKDKENIWRFSLMRWNPAGSVTWGGRVHETGRWGLIRWEKPPEAERLNILKYLIRRAWYKYQTVKTAQIDYWSCQERGDPEFYRLSLKPVVESFDAYGKDLPTIDSWNKEKIEEIFHQIVPEWMEFSYRVEELRKQYLRKKHFP